MCLILAKARIMSEITLRHIIPEKGPVSAKYFLFSSVLVFSRCLYSASRKRRDGFRETEKVLGLRTGGTKSTFQKMA